MRKRNLALIGAAGLSAFALSFGAGAAFASNSSDDAQDAVDDVAAALTAADINFDSISPSRDSESITVDLFDPDVAESAQAIAAAAAPAFDVNVTVSPIPVPLPGSTWLGGAFEPPAAPGPTN